MIDRQDLFAFIAKLGVRKSHAYPIFGYESIRERDDVAWPFSEWRNFDWKNIDSVVEILTKLSLSNLFGEVLVCGGDNS